MDSVKDSVKTAKTVQPKRKRQKRATKSSTPSTINKLKSPSGFGVSNVVGISRSISACQRCRLKKLKCDHHFPKCDNCKKNGCECVGLDPATGREVPRSYTVYLEERISFLERQLKLHGVNDFDIRPLKDPKVTEELSNSSSNVNSTVNSAFPNPATQITVTEHDKNNIQFLTDPKIVPLNPAMKSQSAEDTDLSLKVGNLSTESRETNEFSFARLMYVALRQKTSQDGCIDSSLETNATLNNTNPISNSLLDTKASTQIKPATLPKKELAEQYIMVFFSQANSQLPVLHREEFIQKYFLPVYGNLSTNISLASDYSSIHVSRKHVSPDRTYYYHYTTSGAVPTPEITICLYFLNIIFAIATTVHHQQYPESLSESYRKAALQYIDAVYSTQDGLERLQCLLILSLYSLMRPSTPGIWYVLGSAIRLAIDLGLHTEVGIQLWSKTNNSGSGGNADVSDGISSSGNVCNGFNLEMRRRLFWCTYALDRQIGFNLGRPFGIPEECIKVPFPTELDDSQLITKGGTPDTTISDFSLIKVKGPSYKVVSLSILKIRQIQSEIQRIMYECAEIPRVFKNFEQWRKSMAQRLENWNKTRPYTLKEMNCNFNLTFFELNHHETRLRLYGLCPLRLSITTDDYFQIADAGKHVIKCYFELNKTLCINYTWLSIQNLFTAGSSYLFTIYHSPEVRKVTSLQEFEFLSSACAHVLSTLISKSEAAANCCETIKLLSSAIIKLYYMDNINEEDTKLQKSNNRMSLNVNVNPHGIIWNSSQAQNYTKNSDTIPNMAYLQSATINGNNELGASQGNVNFIPPEQYNGGGPSNSNINSPINPQIATMQSFGIHQQGDNELNMVFPWGDELDKFFSDAAALEELSPDTSPGGRSNNDSQTPVTRQISPLIHSVNKQLISTPIKHDDVFNAPSYLPPLRTGFNSRDSRPRFRDDRQKVYDLIHQLPFSSSWDPFLMPELPSYGSESDGRKNLDEHGQY